MEQPQPEQVLDVWATKPPEDPYFDGALDAWILSRYHDVVAALREPLLVPAYARSTAPAVPVDSAAHAQFRSQAAAVLAPARLKQWEAQFAPLADSMAGALPTCEPVDLVEQFAKPWSLEVAGIATDVPADQCERLSGFARSIFDSGCEPYDAALQLASWQATAELARFFQGAPPLHMQMFIALAHSLPSFLGNAWLTLLQHPAQLSRLRQEPSLLPKAIDELMRLAGPARAQFRQAVADVGIGACTLPQQQHVILRLDRANRDPEHFPEPNELQFDGRPADHLAFGGGLHACVAATLIRSAAAVATKALIESFSLPERFIAVPANCLAMRYVKSLIVVPQALPAADDQADASPNRPESAS